MMKPRLRNSDIKAATIWLRTKLLTSRPKHRQRIIHNRLKYPWVHTTSLNRSRNRIPCLPVDPFQIAPKRGEICAKECKLNGVQKRFELLIRCLR